MATKVDAIIESLKSLTLLEASELVKQIEVTFNVNATNLSVSSVLGPTTDLEVKSEKDIEEQLEFTVVLEEVPLAKKIPILKVVRSLTGLGLKDAKNLVESCPKSIKENLSKDDANNIKQQLEESGAKVVIK
uniref:50S ribosomal protein L12, chloroplastic n=1 Tax=Hildenbrandia rivularis TaxID=135206 RepID=A0A1C9CFL4_9FLOR|nr:ribosomal protein L12 [Hildenbrandia rivularis]AOM67188.1 ribosomal protein L12 [Hildenbrandia rivularis]